MISFFPALSSLIFASEVGRKVFSGEIGPGKAAPCFAHREQDIKMNSSSWLLAGNGLFNRGEERPEMYLDTETESQIKKFH